MYGRDRTDRAEQLHKVTAEMERRGIALVETVTDTNPARPALQEALQLLDARAQPADVLFVARLDCLAGPTHQEFRHIANILVHPPKNGWGLQVLDFDLDLSQSTDNLVAMIWLSTRMYKQELLDDSA